ncbi:MAG: aspartate aminotransferase family protein [Planctomycetaceae bacterium]|jgi:predicted acetylornithine/succinylornithine family transaminase|nr:aspartate aminotransferase family protein [Planctomycetaceae bacterium]
MTTQQTLNKYQQYVIGNYTRFPVVLVRGEGSRIWDADGKCYIDFFPGWGCGLLGHCPPPIVKAVQKQMETLIHVPNSWHTEQQAEWAQMLSERSFGKAFFCNSGTEANEAAIKLVRLATPKERYKIITFHGSFHGRTMGSISATAQPKYHDGLQPLLPGFTYVPHGDINAVKDAIDHETAAIMIEPIQGEGGVRMPPSGFLKELRNLCDTNDLILIFDEVQTGCGRTGEWFAYQTFGVLPDVITVAKAVSGSLPGAAMLVKENLAPALRPGMHAATYGGNPISAAAGIATIKMIEEQGLLENVRKLETLFLNEFNKLHGELEIIQDVRGKGVMIGVELSVEGERVVNGCRERGLLINCTHGNVIRLLPAMNLTVAEAQEGIDIIADVLRNL